MNPVEQAAAILRKNVDLQEPFDKKWKVNALELVIKNLAKIGACSELGLRAIEDKERRELIRTYVGQDGRDGHLGFNVWLLDECIGDTSSSKDHVFMRCMSCQKIRTNKRIGDGPCRCGGRKLTNMVGPMNTRRALGYLASGY